MTLLTPDEARRLGDNARAAFLEHGWWVSPEVLDGAALDELQYGVDRFYGEDLDWHLPAVPPGDTPRGATGTRQNDYVSLQVQEVRDLVLSPVIGALLAAIGGHNGVRLFHDQLIHKDPGAPSVGWHTDRSYWLTCSSTEMLTAWVPLVDVDDHNGALRVVDRGLQTDVDHDRLRGFHQAGSSVPDLLTGHDLVSVPVPRGHISIHHARTLHCSGPNVADRGRTALAIHAQPLENHYVPPKGAAPRLHFNDVLCRRTAEGSPDYADPYVCPVMWAEATESA